MVRGALTGFRGAAVLAVLSLVVIFPRTVSGGSRLSSSNGPLRSVIVQGNDKVERQAILNIIRVKPGTYLNADVCRAVDARLNNSGLFKEVKVWRHGNRDGTADLYIHVAEKHTWFIMPLVQAWSGRYSGGFIFGESNLFGSNKKTLLAVNAGNKISQVFFVYKDSYLFDTNYCFRLDALWRKDHVPVYRGDLKTGEVVITDAGAVVYPGYKWTPNITTLLAIDYRRVWVKWSDAFSPLPSEGHDLAVRFEFIYDSLKRRNARLHGTKLRAAFEFSDPRLGSDFQYNKQLVELQQAFLIGRYFYAITAFEGKMGRSLPFHKEFTLGGTALRGYSDRQFRGDTYIRLKNEFYYPIVDTRSFSVKGLVFFDSGLLYRDSEGLNRDNFNNGAGGGIRFFLKEVVAPFFGFDVGYGIERGDYSVYLALGLVSF